MRAKETLVRTEIISSHSGSMKYIYFLVNIYIPPDKLIPLILQPPKLIIYAHFVLSPFFFGRAEIKIELHVMFARLYINPAN